MTTTATATATKALTTLTIIVRQWFDKTNGNSYYSARVIANGKTVYTFPISYGHGELTVLNRTNGVLYELGFQVPKGPDYRDSAAYYEYQEAGIPLTIDTAIVARKQDLHQ